MADLYKGIAGSPITYLAADISANQTTISIADDSALPDAPNIATIGYGEQLETIKYETKSNGVLQNVTRGIEGTPRAWPAGTEVARFFTAYDHNAIIENFNSHLAESAKKHITESGENENGSYVRFDDGTQICRRTITSSEATSYSYVEQGINFKGWAFTWKFPKPFKGGGDYSVFGTALLTGTTIRNMSINLESGLFYDRVPLRFETFVQTGSGFHALVTAIGRWK